MYAADSFQLVSSKSASGFTPYSLASPTRHTYSPSRCRVSTAIATICLLTVWNSKQPTANLAKYRIEPQNPT